MKALTIKDPTPDVARAYIAGVLHGDGWLTARTLGLRVADQDFAESFCAALASGYGRTLTPRIDERGYYLVRTSARLHDLEGARSAPCGDVAARGAWVRGLFDSEGTACLGRKPRSGPNSWDRVISMCSTESATLDRASGLLADLGMRTRRRVVPHYPGDGHLGQRVVHELCLAAGREQYRRFAELVGSSIARKADVLAALPASYVDDLAQARRDAQLIGAATRRARADGRLAEVVDGIRAAIASGTPPTQRQLGARVPGYWAQQRRHTSSGLLEMACAR